MKIMLIGGGKLGIFAINQLKKNENIEIILADSRESPPVVEAGLLEKVDFQQTINPMNLDSAVNKYNPDLILIALATEDLSLDRITSGDILMSQLIQEILSISGVPAIVVSREFIL